LEFFIHNINNNDNKNINNNNLSRTI